MEKSFCRVSAAVFCALLAVAAVAQDASPVCALTASNTGPYDAGSTISLSASGDPTATYAWTGPNGYVSDQENPTITNADLSRTGTYTVTSGGCSATTSVVVSQPTIMIDNPSTKTGPKGTITQLTFHITLSYPSTETVSVEYYTSNSTAIAGRDYQATSGTAVFQPGSTEQDVPVNIYGTNTNPQKALFLNLYEADNGAIQTIYGYPVKGRGVILAK
jgi:hypothetical protein